MASNNNNSQDLLNKVAQLEAQVRELQGKLNNKSNDAKKREKVSVMSAEVVDSNPYRYCSFHPLY